ncbi:MAG: exodeoxyribonuclease VII large subunit [Alphaproteobacteria bacterium]|nr:exodeoxyribonuclease VII large subunit [Alphaproteobacteria bacterium]
MNESTVQRDLQQEAYTVSELAGALKRTLEGAYGRVRVRGELSRVSIAASGHMYSSLKDAGSVLDAVCWRATLAKLHIKPEEGLEVICTGKITTYPARSNYQLIIDQMELAGQGALLKMLEERRKKLAAEGLFDAARKRRLPFLPQRIGVVTSPTGAVIRDILHRIADRFPRPVMLWPVMVQGEQAAQQIVTAIEGFNRLEESLRPDVLIVARGGGSLEDLMPFNEEVVVRAAAASSIPLISSVGHETDTTLIDHAADVRAPTPTAAAEMAVPVRADLIYTVQTQDKRMHSAVMRSLSELRQCLRVDGRVLDDPMRFLALKIQALDHLATRLKRPDQMLQQAQERLSRWVEMLQAQPEKILQQKHQLLQHSTQLLQAFSFEKTLQRGFAIVRDAQGHVINDPDTVQDGQGLDISFAAGKRIAVVVRKEHPT